MTARIFGPFLFFSVALFCSAPTLRGQWQDSTLEDYFLDFRDVVFADESVGFLAAWSITFDGVNLWGAGRTTDGGDVWLWQSGVGVELTSVHFHDLEHGFMAGRSPQCDCPIVIYTDDGLATSPSQQFPEFKGIFTSLVSSDADHGFFAGGNSVTGEGFVVRTTDGGSSFSVVMRQPNAYVAGIAQPDEQTLILSIGAGKGRANTLWKTTNADAEPESVVWTPIHTFASGEVTEMHFVDRETGYLTFAPFENPESVGEVYRTTNGGTEWERVYGSDSFVPEGLDFLDRDNGFVVGSGGMILQTTDGGDSWRDTIPGPTFRLLAVDYVSPSFAYAVGEQGAMLRYEKNSSAVRAEQEEDGQQIEYVRTFFQGERGGIFLAQNDLPSPAGCRVFIFDPLGKNVAEEDLPGPGRSLRLDIPNPGLYFFAVVSNGIVLQRGRFLLP